MHIILLEFCKQLRLDNMGTCSRKKTTVFYSLKPQVLSRISIFFSWVMCLYTLYPVLFFDVEVWDALKLWETFDFELNLN